MGEINKRVKVEIKDKNVKRLFRLLDEKGLTMTWASEKLELSLSTISRWGESRGSAPHHHSVIRIKNLIAELEKMEVKKDE